VLMVPGDAAESEVRDGTVSYCHIHGTIIQGKKTIFCDAEMLTNIVTSGGSRGAWPTHFYHYLPPHSSRKRILHGLMGIGQFIVAYWYV